MSGYDRRVHGAPDNGPGSLSIIFDKCLNWEKDKDIFDYLNELDRMCETERFALLAAWLRDESNADWVSEALVTATDEFKFGLVESLANGEDIASALIAQLKFGLLEDFKVTVVTTALGVWMDGHLWKWAHAQKPVPAQAAHF